MSAPFIALTVSLVITFVLFFYFRSERTRGARSLRFYREHLDFWVLKIGHAIRHFLRTVGRDFFRQVMHYLFHTVLLGLLSLLREVEEWVKRLLRSNRTLAKRSEKERATRSKLEEVALHKLSVQLSEEEKKRRKERMLNG